MTIVTAFLKKNTVSHNILHGERYWKKFVFKTNLSMVLEKKQIKRILHKVNNQCFIEANSKRCILRFKEVYAKERFCNELKRSTVC